MDMKPLWGDKEIEDALSLKLRASHDVPHQVESREHEGGTKITVQVGDIYAAMLVDDESLRMPLQEFVRIYGPVLTEELEKAGAYGR